MNGIDSVNHIYVHPFQVAKQAVSKIIDLIRRIIRAIAQFFTEDLPNFFKKLFAKKPNDFPSGPGSPHSQNPNAIPTTPISIRRIKEPKVKAAIDQIKEIEKELLDASIREDLAKKLGTMPGSTSESEFEDLTASGLALDQCNIFDYFSLDLDKLSTQLSETKPVRFRDRKIFSVEEISEEDQFNTKKVFFRLLQETYGTQLAASVLARYDVELEGNPLTGGDVKRIMVGIGAHVEIDHLKGLFDDIKKEETALIALQCAKRLLPTKDTSNERLDLYNSIKAANKFEDLNSEQIGFLLSAYRTIPTTMGQGKIRDVLYPGLRISKTPFSDKFPPFLEDLKFLETVEQWSELILEHYALSISEYVGKTLAYRDLKEGLIVAIPSPENKPIYYRVYKSFDKEGVIPALLVPINYKKDPNYIPDSSADKRHLPDKENIHLVFRGTTSMQQLYRDLDWRGVGKKTFYDACPAIMDMVTDYLKENKSKDVALFIEGHSLGGCDTQRGLIKILEMATKYPSKWKAVKMLHATTHNSPRPEHSLNQRFKKALAAMLEKGIQIPMHLTHVRYFDNRGEDFIQMWGDILIGADKDRGDPVVVNGKKEKEIFHHTVLRQLIDIKIPGINNPIDLHNYKAFNNKFGGQADWKFKRNVIDFGLSDIHSAKIDKRFAKLYHWEEKETTSKLGWLMASASFHAPFAGSAIMNGLQFVLNHIFGMVLHSSRKIKPARAIKLPELDTSRDAAV